jgi:hypothetical protein
MLGLTPQASYPSHDGARELGHRVVESLSEPLDDWPPMHFASKADKISAIFAWVNSRRLARSTTS